VYGRSIIPADCAEVRVVLIYMLSSPLTCPSVVSTKRSDRTLFTLFPQLLDALFRTAPSLTWQCQDSLRAKTSPYGGVGMLTIHTARTSWSKHGQHGGPQIAAPAVILVLGGISPARGERTDSPCTRAWTFLRARVARV
jgi:hypothetical protein